MKLKLKNCVKAGLWIYGLFLTSINKVFTHETFDEYQTVYGEEPDHRGCSDDLVMQLNVVNDMLTTSTPLSSLNSTHWVTKHPSTVTVHRFELQPDNMVAKSTQVLTSSDNAISAKTQLFMQEGTKSAVRTITLNPKTGQVESSKVLPKHHIKAFQQRLTNDTCGYVIEAKSKLGNECGLARTMPCKKNKRKKK